MSIAFVGGFWKTETERNLYEEKADLSRKQFWQYMGFFLFPRAILILQIRLIQRSKYIPHLLCVFGPFWSGIASFHRLDTRYENSMKETETSFPSPPSRIHHLKFDFPSLKRSYFSWKITIQNGLSFARYFIRGYKILWSLCWYCYCHFKRRHFCQFDCKTW